MRGLRKHGWTMDQYKAAVIKARGLAGWKRIEDDMRALQGGLF